MQNIQHMTTTTYYTEDNTEGYSTAGLADLNARFAAACGAEGVDPVEGDKSHLDHVAERVQAEFDSRQEADDDGTTYTVTHESGHDDRTGGQ